MQCYQGDENYNIVYETVAFERGRGKQKERKSLSLFLF